MVIQKLSDYCRKLGAEDFMTFACAVLCMKTGQTDKYTLTFGCTLIRDFTCCGEKDYGKMQPMSPILIQMTFILLFYHSHRKR